MNIVQLTPGTGNFHCGTCLRDHAVVKQLRTMGHQTLMVPLYMPFVTDGADASDHAKIFYGGVSVYLEQKFKLFRHTPRWLDRIIEPHETRKELALALKMTRDWDYESRGEFKTGVLQT